jgi:hypothetical protein
MHSTRLIVATLTLNLIGAIASAQQEAQPKLPVAVVSTNLVMLGTINSYETKKCEFRISNAGEAPLQIQELIPTCSCITGIASKTTLQPKEEGLVTLSLDARLVHSKFTRSVWVVTNDPKTPRILLSLKGDLQPLFLGLPPMPVSLRAKDANTVWTNSFTLTAAETNMFLGLPMIQSNEFVQLSLTITTNVAERMSYTVTTFVKALAPTLHAASVTFPVIGRPGTKPNPIQIKFQTKTGAELSVIPNRILLNPDGSTLPKHVVIHTSESVANTNLLSWTPMIKGVDISILPPRGFRSNILLTVNVSAEAGKRLLKEDKRALTFTYPNHKPAKLSFAWPNSPEK